MIEETAHETSAAAIEETVCIEIDRHDILTLLQVKPHAGLDMMAVMGRQFHAAQQLVRGRAARNANEVIEEQVTGGERIADEVARFGGSWAFIILFGTVLMIYTAINVGKAAGTGRQDGRCSRSAASKARLIFYRASFARAKMSDSAATGITATPATIPSNDSCAGRTEMVMGNLLMVSPTEEYTCRRPDARGAITGGDHGSGLESQRAEAERRAA